MDVSEGGFPAFVYKLVGRCWTKTSMEGTLRPQYRTLLLTYHRVLERNAAYNAVLVGGQQEMPLLTTTKWLPVTCFLPRWATYTMKSLCTQPSSCCTKAWGKFWLWCLSLFGVFQGINHDAVSYTHLDVYKRQVYEKTLCTNIVYIISKW